MLKKIFSIILIVSLSGCALFDKDEDEANSWTLERLYSEAKRSMQRQNYNRAIELYEFLETRYPFGVYGQQALLDLAYVYYKIGNEEQALSTTDRFIRLYPQNPHVDYAFYLQGLINFNKNKSLSDRFVRTDASQRDVSSAYASFQNFSELLERFPASRYSQDAIKRMVFLRNVLAQNEIHVASYYLRRRAFIAAINRARYVIENYSKTPSVPDALVILAKAYRLIELDDLANDTLRILKMNHPSHPGISEAESIVLN
ncbi:MAG: outer membrane protein assembly factor BamD [Gammaproteobacteria bacterium]|nr:outer membrane protein assembly factor BamD [Gammaproteobacteria bacterium]